MTKLQKSFLLFLFVPLAGGLLAWIFTRNGIALYSTMRKPPLSPPGILFPVVWTILYGFMGISSWLVWRTRSQYKDAGLLLYGIQLAANLLWVVWFFRFQAYFFAFAWLLCLLVLVLTMAKLFARINETAGKLQIPYVLWLCFAAYLNLGASLLN